MNLSEGTQLLLALDNSDFSTKLTKKLIEKFSAKEIIFLSQKVKDSLSEEEFLSLKNAISKENIEKSISKLEKYRIFCVSWFDKEYPQSLRNIPSYPLILYYRGDVSLLSEDSIAIVGTRRPTHYGREVARLFANKLSQAGLITISGLAYGLDMEVAYETLESDRKTIAVLGGGLDKIYPSQNSSFADTIVERGGLILSLYPPLKRPNKYSFLERNRIISGLSLGTIIVEAGEGSGSLNTAHNALKQGKKLFVIPGNINNPACVGSNRLIEEYPETITLDPEKVLRTFNIKETKIAKKTSEKSAKNDVEKIISDLLYEQDLDFDTLKEKTNLDSKLLIRRLTMMEINGLIKKLPNNFFTLTKYEG